MWLALSTVLKILFIGLPLHADETFMSRLDDCQEVDGDVRARLERVADIVGDEVLGSQPLSPGALPPFRRNRRQQAYLDMEVVRWHTTRCVQEVILKNMGPDLEAAQAGTWPEARETLTKLALYQGLKSGVSGKRRCTPGGDPRACTREAVVADLERQAVTIAVRDFFADLNSTVRAQPKLSLRTMCRNRLMSIDRRITNLETELTLSRRLNFSADERSSR